MQRSGACGDHSGRNEIAARKRCSHAGIVRCATVIGCDYSDVALLGKAVTRGPRWRLAGFAFHAVNGAVFGLAFYELRERLDVGSRRLALAMALAEHVTLYPLGYFVDRYHPARGQAGIPRL